jgi:hypothetical protein
MCNSLDGSHSRAATRTAAIFAHEMRSLPTGSSRSHSSARPVPRHNASAKYTSPNRRERSIRMPFKRTATVICSLPSSNSCVCSGAPISRRASARASTRPCSSSSPRCATVCWMTRCPTRTHTAYQAPIAVNLSVLLANRVAQVHAPSEPAPPRKKIPKVVTTRSNRSAAPPNPLIRLTPAYAKSPKLPPTAQVELRPVGGRGSPKSLMSSERGPSTVSNGSLAACRTEGMRRRFWGF